MYRIGVIEDDEQLCNLISQGLKKFGFMVENQFDFKNLSEEIIKSQLNLILLDINLPYYDGYHIAKELRLKSNIPIIMISARDSEAEQIRGFDLGVDDYVVKPFSMEILRAKINACLRRSYQENDNQERIRIGEFEIHKKNFQISYHTRRIELTKNEMKIIIALAEHVDQIVKRDMLLNELWDDMTFVEDNTLTVNITRIKSKLCEIGLSNVIHTKRGEGYMLKREAL